MKALICVCWGSLGAEGYGHGLANVVSQWLLDIYMGSFNLRRIVAT